MSLLKGIHPGMVLERELAKRKLPKGRFAISLNEFPQTLVAITKGKRKMNTALAMKIEVALGLEEGYFMTLQIFYDIKEMKRKQNSNYHPDLTLIRPVLFWDTTFEKIDWVQQKKAVIQRVFERGNAQEKDEMTHFYGEEVVRSVLKNVEIQK